ncbi:hypothetical protein ABPG72_013492 [Tetrahymena utriculariae]
MNQEEQDKFTKVISDAYEELINCRPEKPLDHFIYYILSTLPADQRNKDAVVRAFFDKYCETYLKNIKNIA